MVFPCTDDRRYGALRTPFLLRRSPTPRPPLPARQAFPLRLPLRTRQLRPQLRQLPLPPRPQPAARLRHGLSPPPRPAAGPVPPPARRPAAAPLPAPPASAVPRSASPSSSASRTGGRGARPPPAGSLPPTCLCGADAWPAEGPLAAECYAPSRSAAPPAPASRSPGRLSTRPWPARAADSSVRDLR